MMWYNILTNFINNQKGGLMLDSILESIKELIGLLKKDYVRINVSVSTKGVHTYDVTVKSLQGRKHTVEESDQLVSDMEKRYPREVI